MRGNHFRALNSWMWQLDTLERELRARERYWHHQELEEARLADRLGALGQELLSTPGRAAGRPVRPGSTTWRPRPHRFPLQV